MLNNAAPQLSDTYLNFDGVKTFIQVPNIPEYSVATAGVLTVSAWIRHDVEDFPHSESTGYVNWMGKGTEYGANGDQEWECRMYGEKTTDCPRRPHRTSFYVFNPEGGLGVGSYVQDETVVLHAWRHIVGVADGTRTYLYRNGQLARCDSYTGAPIGKCDAHQDRNGNPLVITPVAGNSPLRIGTLNGVSFFLGVISRVRIWGAVLTPDEILGLYRNDMVPQRDNLVAEFRLDEGSGIKAGDSVKGNDGMICYGTWVKGDSW
jgi:hypothetical protein